MSIINFKKLSGRISSGVITLSLMLSLGGFLAPAKAEAQMSVIDAANLAWNKISAVADELMSDILGSLEIKEYVLDDIAFALAKMALQDIVKSTVSWINSGFEGNPAFITDLKQHLINTADEIAGEIIYGTDLGFLCSPLELDVRVALATQYEATQDLAKEVQCTLSDTVANVDDFLNGNFAAGNWGGWLEFVTVRQNNPLGAQAIAEAKLTNEILRAREEEIVMSEWAEGFLSWEECTERPGGEPDCNIVTPGNVISEHLSFSLSTGERTLIEADEINEVISALFAQLANQAITGVGGLLGLSGGGGSGGGGSPSYLDQIGNPAYDTTTTGGGGGTSNDAVSFISGSITDEREYRSIQQRVVDRAVSVIAQAGSCNASVVSGATTIRNSAQTSLNTSLSTEALLQGMQFRYNAAGPEEQLAIAEEFQTLRTSGTLHDRISNLRAEEDADDNIARLNDLASNIRPCPTNGTGGGNVSDR